LSSGRPGMPPAGRWLHDNHGRAGPSRRWLISSPIKLSPSTAVRVPRSGALNFLHLVLCLPPGELAAGNRTCPARAAPGVSGAGDEVRLAAGVRAIFPVRHGVLLVSVPVSFMFVRGSPPAAT